MGDGFCEAIDSAVLFQMRLMDSEEGIAQERQRANQVGITAAGGIFAQTGILTPVQAVFDPSPMIPHMLNPMFGRVGIGGAVADVVAGLIERRPLTRAEMPDGQGALRMREIHLQRFNRLLLNPPGFLASMSFLDYIKKGVGAVFLARWVLRVGWLPFTWSK